ncbi:uncharacterized protein LOC134266761 isoform X3 [Saccostrea cucullata]|uniref:uncharacterized protein LOC134266761 isoform X3 n=1 Tax=Saccostrea cuccullata TaxID=36930 RepID=UPI002ED66E26
MFLRTVFGLKIAVLTISFALGQDRKETIRRVCPREVLTYVSEGSACNRSLEDLRSSIRKFRAYFYQRWCRNRSDCLHNQDCLQYGDLGVCSATKTINISTVEKHNRENKTDGYDIGHVVGAAIGGLGTGLGIWAVVMFILKKNQKSLKDQSSDLQVQYENKYSFEIEIGKSKGDQKEPLDDEDKEYSTVTNVPKNNEDLYNHLNEVKDENNLGIYDHAHHDSTTS